MEKSGSRGGRARYLRILAPLAAAALLAAAPVAAQTKTAGPAQANQVSLAGTVARVMGATIFVTTEGASRPVSIGADTLMLSRRTATLASIQSGEALGVAAVQAEDGSLSATAINVFPAELWQRARKGQFPMANGQVMTNAEVERLGSTVKGRVLYLKYDMLSAAILVPEGTEIRRTVVASLGDLRAGMAVSVRGVLGADGVLAATTISFEGGEGR